ncbi:MAG: hypothetical protein WC749_07565 [Dehalococcoidia bacterium]
MQAQVTLKIRPVEVREVQQVGVEKGGRLAKFNRAVSKLATFHRDEKLVEMGSPYRWIQ